MTEKVSYTENGKINFDQSVVEIKPVDQINMNGIEDSKEIGIDIETPNLNTDFKFGSLERIFSKAEFEESDTFMEKVKKLKCCNFEFITKYQSIIITIILALLNLINNTDRYVVSSRLIDIETYFNISKSTAGLLQTIFLLTYMAFSPLNGYLGDRVNRKYLLIFGILIWLVSTIGGSFVNAKGIVLFTLSRSLFGIATASFEILAIPILGDVFKNNQKHRDFGLIILNLGAPLGVGFSYLIGLIAKDLEPNDWRYTMRFTPFLLTAVLVIIIIAYQEPEREITKRKETKVLNDDSVVATTKESKNSSFTDDLKSLCRNKTYVLLSFAWMFCLSALGAFNWWSATLIDYSLSSFKLSHESIEIAKKSYSICQAVGGAVGLLLPVKLSNYYKTKKGVASIDCYLLSIGLYVTTFFLYFYLATLSLSPYLSIFLYTMTIMFFNTCWVMEANMLLDILKPNLRATGNAITICLLHLIGDSIAPYWVGLIADNCLEGSSQNKTLLSSLLFCTELSYYPIVFVSFAGASLALFTSLTFDRDKERANEVSK